MDTTEAREIIRDLDHTEACELATIWANCTHADFVAGDVWIENPQRGHWINEDKLIEFANWIKSQ